jgi:hypothetical protein
MLTGLVIIMAVLMALGVAANPAEPVGARCGLPGQIPWPGGCGCGTGSGSGDTMNTFAAKDLEAADLLALARLDDDGAPCSGGLSRPQLARPVPDMTPGIEHRRPRPRSLTRPGPGRGQSLPDQPPVHPVPAGQLPDRRCYSPLVRRPPAAPCCGSRSRRAARRASRRAWARP